MHNLNRFKIKLLVTTFFITVCLSPAMVDAQNKQVPVNISQKPSGSLLDRILSLFEAPENSLVSQGEICVISPGNMGKQIIWSDRPLFILKGAVPQSQLNLYSPAINYNYEQNEQLLWTETVPANTQTLTYAGEKLQPGFVYDWQFSTQSQTYPPLRFSLMEQSEREAIAIELTTIENRLQVSGATTENIAIAKANYFVNKQLWSDALQQLHLVKNPSSNLIKKIARTEQYLCESNNF